MGLFGSKKKNVVTDDLPAIPPRFAPEEVHTAYKEALAKDSLPATQLPPEQTPQSLQQAPVQDSLSSQPSQAPASPPLPQASPNPFAEVSAPTSLDDAVSNNAFDAVSDDPLTTVADVPVSVPEQAPMSPPPQNSPEPMPVDAQANLSPEAEVPSVEPELPSSHASLDDAVSNAPSDEFTPIDTSSFDKSVGSSYIPSANSVTDYSAQTSHELPVDFPVPSPESDDLTPIAPEEPTESFDESKLPEIGVPVDEYTSNMASLSAAAPTPEPDESAPFDQEIVPAPEVQAPVEEQFADAPSMSPLDLAPPQPPADLPSSMPNDNPDDVVAPELAPIDTSSAYNEFSAPMPPSTPQAPATVQVAQEPYYAPPGAIAPVEERVILKHAVGTDVFVEKFVYEDVLLAITAVQKDLQHAGSHLDKVFRDELAVTKKIDDWNKDMNIIQEKLMTIDIRLFEKGDV